MPATKSYHLHFALQTGPAVSMIAMPAVESFTVAPHDALFTGLFLQEAAAKRYINLNKGVAPYRCLGHCSSMLDSCFAAASSTDASKFYPGDCRKAAYHASGSGLCIVFAMHKGDEHVLQPPCKWSHLIFCPSQSSLHQSSMAMLCGLQMTVLKLRKCTAAALGGGEFRLVMPADCGHKVYCCRRKAVAFNLYYSMFSVACPSGLSTSACGISAAVC